MSQKIVSGYDGSDGGRDAVALGSALANSLGAEHEVCAVLPHPRGPAHGDPESAPELETERLFAAVEQLPGGRDAEMRAVRSASPARGLNDVAEAEEPLLVVLGSTHRGPLGRVLLGSVGEAFVSGAPCAVAVAPTGWARGGQTGFPRIGAAINGSADSWPALHAAGELARRLEAQFTLLAAVEPMSYAYTAAILGALSGEDSDALAQAEMERILDRGTESIPAGLEVERRLLIGDPSRLLAEAAEDLDLLVVGSRGYGPIRRVLLGGVSGKLMRSCPCPLLVLPRGAGTDPMRTA